MADRSLSYRLYGQDVTAGKTIEGVGRKAAKTESGLRKMGSSLGAVLGGAALLKFGKDSVKAFVESEQATTRLDAALAKNAKTAGLNAAAFSDLAEARAKTTRYDDDASAAALAQLAQYRLTEDQLRELLPLVQDYAAKTGKDLTTAATKVGKAIMGKGRALADVGIRFKDAGSEAANLDQVVGGLREQVGGFAEKDGKTASGQLAILSSDFGELQEDIGEELLPVLMDLGKKLHTALTFADENSGTVKAVALIGGGLWSANKAMNVGKGIYNSMLITLGKKILMTRVHRREVDAVTAAYVRQAAAANLPQGGGALGKTGGLAGLLGKGGSLLKLGAAAAGGPVAIGATLALLASKVADDQLADQRAKSLKDPNPEKGSHGWVVQRAKAIAAEGQALDELRAATARASADSVRLGSDLRRQVTAHVKVEQAAVAQAHAMETMRLTEALAIGPKTKLLTISDKQRDAYNKEVAAIRASYNAFDEAPKRAALTVTQVVDRIEGQLAYQRGLAGAARTLVAKGVNDPLLEELQKLEKSAPGTMEVVAKGATPAFVEQMKRDMGRLAKTSRVLADPLIAAADVAGRSAGITSADKYLATVGYHIQKGARAIGGMVPLPGDVRVGDARAAAPKPSVERQRATGRPTADRRSPMLVDLTPSAAAAVARAVLSGGGSAAVNGGRVG